jgi:hypothetical protein
MTNLLSWKYQPGKRNKLGVDNKTPKDRDE